MRIVFYLSVGLFESLGRIELYLHKKISAFGLCRSYGRVFMSVNCRGRGSGVRSSFEYLIAGGWFCAHRVYSSLQVFSIENSGFYWVSLYTSTLAPLYDKYVETTVFCYLMYVVFVASSITRSLIKFFFSSINKLLKCLCYKRVIMVIQ